MSEQGKNEGVIVEPLFVACTRPSMYLGVPLYAFLLEFGVVTEAFVWTKSLQTLALVFPIHGVLFLICLKEPRIFELLNLWVKTKGNNSLTSFIYWQSSSRSPLSLHLFRPKKYFKKLLKG